MFRFAKMLFAMSAEDWGHLILWGIFFAQGALETVRKKKNGWMKTKERKMINVKGLRDLYKRAPSGQKNRREIKITMTPETMDILSSIVPVGRGKYGSAFIELSTRFLLALLAEGEDVDDIATELLYISRSPYLENNIKRLLKILSVS
jgi:hypothetical protein